jgi:dTDP-4-amino-4,6-dideoxygalactose transaminase
MINFFNVNRQYQQDRAAYLDLADRVYSSGQVINGEYCRKLENSLKSRTGRKHCVLTASCTDALAFVGSNYIKFDSVVIFPNISFPATDNGFIRELSKYRFNCLYLETDNNGIIDLDCLEGLLEQLKDQNRKVVVVWVNLFGHTVDYDRLNIMQQTYSNVEFAEDAAQSFGASWKSIPSGAMGSASCFSFDPTKNLGAFGIGGAMLTDSNELADAVDLHRRPHTPQWINYGYNSQINEVDAAIVWWKLENRFDGWQQRRTDIAEYYINHLNEYTDIVKPHKHCASAWHKFVIKHRNRDNIKSKLSEFGVDTRIHYPRTLSGSENLFTKSCLSLPMYPELSDSEVEHVVKSTVSAVKLLS